MTAFHHETRDIYPLDSRAIGDGSVDLFFGPEPPTGKRDKWVPAKAGGRLEAIFRFYGPDEAVFDKSWVLPDIEKRDGR
jgi:hypothetical protein